MELEGPIICFGTASYVPQGPIIGCGTPVWGLWGPKCDFWGCLQNHNGLNTYSGASRNHSHSISTYKTVLWKEAHRKSMKIHHRNLNRNCFISISLWGPIVIRKEAFRPTCCFLPTLLSQTAKVCAESNELDNYTEVQHIVWTCCSLTNL